MTWKARVEKGQRFLRYICSMTRRSFGLFTWDRAAIRHTKRGRCDARDHNAPKLAPLKDVELVAAAQAYGCGTADNLQTLAVIKALDAIGAFGMSTLTEKQAVYAADESVARM